MSRPENLLGYSFMENWVKEYRADLGIALTDIIGVDAFCRDLDRYFAKLYDGFRHDSVNDHTPIR